jgi:hypothetical protein
MPRLKGRIGQQFMLTGAGVRGFFAIDPIYLPHYIK